MKTLDELRDLATRWALDHISHHQAQSRVNLAGIGSGLATAQRFEEESRRALDDALRELIADAERIDWLETVDGRFHNIDRITSVVGVGFNDPPTLRAAIDAARKG